MRLMEVPVNKRPFNRIAHFVNLVALACQPVPACSIKGIVKDANGTPLRNAVVKLETERASYHARSNDRGDFSRGHMIDGIYRVTLSIDGTQRDVVEDVTCGGLTAQVNFDLQREDKKRWLQALSQGKTAYERRQWEVVVQKMSEVVNVNPTEDSAWGLLADAQVQLSDAMVEPERTKTLSSALSKFEAAIRMAPSVPAYHNNYALALAKIGKYADCEREFQSGASLDPTNAWRYFYNLAAVLFNGGQIEPAARAVNKSLALDANNAAAQQLAQRIRVIAMTQDSVLQQPSKRHDPTSGALTVAELDRISAGEHSDMPPAQRIGMLAGASHDTVVHSIINATESTLSVYLSGPTNQFIELAPKTNETIRLLSGRYRVGARVKAPGVLPFYGEQIYDGGSEYQTSFYIDHITR